MLFDLLKHASQIGRNALHSIYLGGLASRRRYYGVQDARLTLASTLWITGAKSSAVSDMASPYPTRQHLAALGLCAASDTPP